MMWINCNPEAGREMKDVHPLVVLSPKEFNDRTGIVIGLPMTTASFNDTNPFAVKFRGPKAAAIYPAPSAEVIRLARQGREAAPVEAGAGGALRDGVRGTESDHRDRSLTCRFRYLEGT
jgi:hypothetical protein